MAVSTHRHHFRHRVLARFGQLRRGAGSFDQDGIKNKRRRKVTEFSPTRRAQFSRNKHTQQGLLARGPTKGEGGRAGGRGSGKSRLHRSCGNHSHGNIKKTTSSTQQTQPLSASGRASATRRRGEGLRSRRGERAFLCVAYTQGKRLVLPTQPELRVRPLDGRGALHGSLSFAPRWRLPIARVLQVD